MTATFAQSTTTSVDYPTADPSALPEEFWEETVAFFLGAAWADVEPGEIAFDVFAMCDFLATEPAEYLAFNNYGNQLAEDRHQLHTGRPVEAPDRAQYFGVIMTGTESACPDQNAYAQTLLFRFNAEMVAELSEDEQDEVIVGVWLAQNEGSRWAELPNEAFSVADVRRLAGEFCVDVDQIGIPAADLATVQTVAEIIPTATDTELVQAAQVIEATAGLFLCPEHLEGLMEYGQR